MKIGIYCESPVDQAAMTVFVEGILGEPPEPINMDLQGRGVSNLLKTLDGVCRGVHYRSDAEALVIVVDSDDSNLHEISHDQPGASVKGCRLCEVRTIIMHARNQLKPVASKASLKFATGVAVPAMEAWYLVGKEHQVGEAAWRVSLAGGRHVFTRQQLKQLVYGTDRASREHMEKCAIRGARRVIGDLKAIEAAFPIGFGLMAKEIRSWKK